MLKIGLTGGIGSGKSYVGKIFRALGVPLYEADIEAKRLMVSDQQIIHSIVDLLGTDAYIGKSLNRSFVAEKVFNNRKLLEGLNRIVHPAVQRDFLIWSNNFVTNTLYVIEEAALLFEAGSSGAMDYIIFVDASETIRMQRIIERDQLTEHEVYKRFESQMDPLKKRKMSDFIIDNNDGMPLLKQIVDLHNHIIKLKE